MTIAISNAGPLIHLAQINQLDLLFTLFEKVVIPQAVYNEVLVSGLEFSYPDARYIQKEIENERIVIKNVSNELRNTIQNPNLHSGELEVITLALHLKEEVVLLDDEEARIFALTFNLKVKGTLGVIIDNVDSGFISPSKGREIVKQLNRIMYLSSDVFGYTLDKIEE